MSAGIKARSVLYVRCGRSHGVFYLQNDMSAQQVIDHIAARVKPQATAQQIMDAVGPALRATQPTTEQAYLSRLWGMDTRFTLRLCEGVLVLAQATDDTPRIRHAIATGVLA